MMRGRGQLVALFALLLRVLEEPTEERLPLDLRSCQRSEQIAVGGTPPVPSLIPGERVLRIVANGGCDALYQRLLYAPGTGDARRGRDPSTEQKRLGTGVAPQCKGERDMLLDHDPSARPLRWMFDLCAGW
jgi:hypothetical protein